MRVGILVEAEEGLDWDGWRTTYAAAERLGFDSVWLSDHWQSPWLAERHGLETWTALAVAAAETRRVGLGPLVSPITFREPAIVARMAEGLDALAPGRFAIGLGLGWNADEHAAAGIPFPPVAERTRRLADGLSRIRCALRGRPVPVLIGGQGRSTLRLAARSADEWNLTTASVTHYQQVAQQLEAMCREDGRDPRAIRHSVATGILIGRDARELAVRAERMRQCVRPLADAADVLDAARALGWLVGTPETVIASLRAFSSAGVDRVMLGHYDVADLGTLSLLADAVLPSVG